MRVVKIFFVFGAALLTGGVGYEYAVRKNELIPNRSCSLPAGYSTCWDWREERVLVFAASRMIVDGKTVERLSGNGRAYDPATGETFCVEESECLDKDFERRNLKQVELFSMSCRDPRSADGRYFARLKPSPWAWIVELPGLQQITTAYLFVLIKLEVDIASSNHVLLDEVNNVRLGEIPESSFVPLGSPQLSFLRNQKGLVNITQGRVDWYDMAELRCTHRPWLWGMTPPFVVVLVGWVIDAIRTRARRATARKRGGETERDCWW